MPIAWSDIGYEDEHFEKLGDHLLGDVAGTIFNPSISLMTDGSFGAVSTFGIVDGTTAGYDGQRTYLMVVGNGSIGITVTSITGGGLTWSKVKTESGGSVVLDVWKGRDTGAAGGTVTVTFSGAVTQGAYALFEVAGVGAGQNGSASVAWANSTTVASATSISVKKSPQGEIFGQDLGPWVLPDGSTPAGTIAGIDPQGADPEFISDILPLRGDVVDWRRDSFNFSNSTARDLPFGNQSFLDKTFNIGLLAVALDVSEIQTADSGWTTLVDIAGGTGRLHVSIKYGQSFNPRQSSTTAARRCGVALELNLGAYPTYPQTNHTYLIKHIKIMNTGGVSNLVEIFKNTAAGGGANTLFSSVLLAHGHAEMNGMWIVNAGTDIVARCSNVAYPVHILVYGLDLTT